MIHNCVCVCVCVRVRFFVTYQDTNLYNDMGMTGITRRGWLYPIVPIFQKAYKSYRMSFFEKVKMCTVFCDG